MIETVLASRSPLRMTLLGIATDDHHFYAVVSWRDDRTEQRVFESLRKSLTMSLNENYGQRKWFTKGADLKRVRDREHLGHLLETYLPSHRGWGWYLGEG